MFFIPRRLLIVFSLVFCLLSPVLSFTSSAAPLFLEDASTVSSATEEVTTSPDDLNGTTESTDDSEPPVRDMNGTPIGGYYFTANSAIGSELRFYVPTDHIHDLTLDASGDVVNMSDSTIYLYCPDFPDYSISASRFSTFTYRVSNYNYSDLNFSNVQEVNFSFLKDTPALPDQSILLVVIFAAIVLFGSLLCFFRRR